MHHLALWRTLLTGIVLIAMSGERRDLGPRSAPGHQVERVAPADELFRTSDRCLACHRGVATSAGEDVSIGFDWRPSMMANSGRDPYWHAAVRREILDYPEAAAAIEDKCSRCHMPMANETAHSDGRTGTVFANLPVGRNTEPEARLAADGVSCAVCHQISPDGLGTEASFTGGFQIARDAPADGRPVYGPFEPDSGGVGIMHSATGRLPTESGHVQTSVLCASCHTLFTHSIRPDGEGPEFPEQVPYLEWETSSFAGEGGKSCQDCHMPEVTEDVPVTQVLPTARAEVSRHVFRGGNFFMIRMLNRYRNELGVTALPQEMALAADRTVDHLREATASVTVLDAELRDGRLETRVEVRNEAGHKFPTAYPSRRAWLHTTIRDTSGRIVFESGAFRPDGSIVGNDNDDSGSGYEPHYSRITEAGQVQIYEGVIVDRSGNVTTGLMSAERWVKENRLLPLGFDRTTTDPRIRVVGEATDDTDFEGGVDEVTYSVGVNPAVGPFTVVAELWYQPVGFRWARNLAGYEAFETQRFVRYYESMASSSAIRVASAGAVVE